MVPGRESTLVWFKSAGAGAQSLRVTDDKAPVQPHGQLPGRRPAKRGQPARIDPRAETRREQRLPANTPVTITVLGILGEPNAVGTVLDMSGSGLRLKLPIPIPCGAPVKLESDDMLMLGEVVRCEPQGQSYSVGLSLSHSLAALSELERLNRALLGHDAEVDMSVRESVRARR
jgi:hypothetical protein